VDLQILKLIHTTPVT